MTNFCKLLNEIDLSECGLVCRFVDKAFLPSPQSQKLQDELQNEVRKHVKDLLVERSRYKNVLPSWDDRRELALLQAYIESVTGEDASSEGLRQLMRILSRDRPDADTLASAVTETTLFPLMWFL